MAGFCRNRMENDTVVALAYTAWDDTDETNYLAGGYWIKGNEAEGVTEIGTFGDAGSGSVFAYYDGQDSSWQRPIIGHGYLSEARLKALMSSSDGDAGVSGGVDVDAQRRLLNELYQWLCWLSEKPIRAREGTGYLHLLDH